MPESFFVGPLSEDELDTLANDLLAYERSSDESHRAWAILLSAAKTPTTRISKLNGIPETRVVQWLANYEIARGAWGEETVHAW